MSLLQRNAECLATLVGVVLYENLKGVTETLGIGFAAAMFGIVLTAAGVIMTLIAKKGAKGTAAALAIHAALWILRGVIGWLAGVAIACFIIYRLFVRHGTVEQNMKEDDTSKMSDFERLPERLTSGGATYYRMWSSSVGAQYVNERDQSDVLSITTIYSFTATEVDTNAGHFFRL